MQYFLALILSFGFAAVLKPPIAAQKPHALEKFGDVRQDPYFWLRDKKDPATLEYLTAENTYADSYLNGPMGPLKDSLFKEIKSHVKEKDQTYPHQEGAYSYFSKTEKGREYPVFYRTPLGKPKQHQVILDENEIAAGHDYTSVSGLSPSDDGKLLAYASDVKGDRLYTIAVKDLASGKLLDDKIEATSGGFAWAADGKTLFYSKPEPITLRDRWILRHTLGQSVSSDVTVFDERDERFSVQVERSLSKRLIEIVSRSKTTSESRFLEADQPLQDFKVFQPRREGVLYSVEDGVDRFFIRTNWQAENFRLMQAPLDHTEMEAWKEVLPYDAKIFLTHLWVFKTHIALLERQGGLAQIRVLDRSNLRPKTVKFKESDYAITAGPNEEYSAPYLRFFYESMSTPETTLDYEFKTGRQLKRKEQDIPGGFKAKNYQTERLFATAYDGTKIPISLVYRKGMRKAAATPLLLYGYGSYGYAMESYFSASRLALLDHGFVYAVAHVRGGSEMGRPWYLNGKLMAKKNTFQDFIACADFLVHEHWTSPEHLYAEGASAGGLLMGAVINSRPEMFHGVIASVPFVDVLTTMLDASLPLTTGEYEEWGNPNDKAAYEFIKSYSPCDNVHVGPFPNLFVRAGLNDTQVGFWEPAKWVAKIRKMGVGPHLVLFKTEMGAGHAGKNGRYTALDRIAEQDAFLLSLEGRTLKY